MTTRVRPPTPTYRRVTTSPGVEKLTEQPFTPEVGPGYDRAVETLTDDTPSMMIDAQVSSEKDPRFAGHVGGGVGRGRRVGWSLRNTNHRIVADTDGTPLAWGFTINPQGLSYDHTARNQLTATKSAFYVDHFGPGPATITLRQLVASGGYVGDVIFGAREDVLTFLSRIYEPAVSRTNNYRVFFHDMHLDRTSGAAGFEVYFPQSAVSVQRSVDLQNVWLVQITMQTLSPSLYGGIHQEVIADTARRNATYVYKVVYGDTLHRIAQKAVRHDSHRYSVEHMIQLILRLNPAIRQTRVIEVLDNGPSNNPFEIVNTPTQLRAVTVTSMHVAPGETLTLPR